MKNHPVCDLSSFVISSEKEQLLKSLDELDITDIIEDEGLKYVAGYVAYRFKNKYPNLETETSLLPAVDDVDWLQFISRGNCLYPSKELLQTARIINAEFTRYHGFNLCKDAFIFKTLTAKVQALIQPTKIPEEVILCLVRTRTFIRVREINQAIGIKNRMRNKKRKLSKFVNKKIN